MKIVNNFREPFEFTFDGVVYGPYPHGEVVDLPYHIALHGIQKSTILDEMGNVEGYRLSTLGEATADPKRAAEILRYECPLVASGECNAKKFKTVDDLRAHMNIHFAPEPEKQQPGPVKK